MTSQHDSKHFISLVEESKKLGTVTKVLADGAYDTKDNFSYLYHENIIPGIKTRKNSSVNTDCYPRRKYFWLKCIIMNCVAIALAMEIDR